MSHDSETKNGARLTVAGLFAGIGGFELGLGAAGHETTLLVEKADSARAVLKARFPGVSLRRDVEDLVEVPKADLIAAGFPCTDLSQAGKTNGLNGSESILIKKLFDLIPPEGNGPRWVLLENVPFALQLHRGSAIRYLIEELDKRRYQWAYRVVDTASFGLPQRRRRLFVLASLDADPRAVLLADDVACQGNERPPASHGFYSTEGNRGAGWAADSLPPLKGSSGLAIPSPPAFWVPGEGFFTPELRDAERCQGFRPAWTNPAGSPLPAGHRWRLIGNAVSIPVAKWIGRRLARPGTYAPPEVMVRIGPQDRLPDSAWGSEGSIFDARVGDRPVDTKTTALTDFLRFDPTPLSNRAAAGFLSRIKRSGLRTPEGFLGELEAFVNEAE